MLLPETCSIKVDGQGCKLAPSFVVSVATVEGEYMLAVVCDDHRDILGNRLEMMQTEGKVPPGKIIFESVKTVVTDCVVGMNEDFVDVELTRGSDSDRKMV